MSSILKALRKVEDEKAALGEGGVDLAHDILKRNYDEPRSFPWLLVGLSAVVLVLIAVAIWWWQQPPATVEVKVASPAPAIIAPPTVVLPPVTPEPQSLKEDKGTAESSDSSESPPAVEQKVDAKIASSTETAEMPVAVPVFATPELSVEEIVYHQDPASRLAIINELPVMVGTDIEGARVEEILTDRVIFSYHGNRFEKPLASE